MGYSRNGSAFAAIRIVTLTKASKTVVETHIQGLRDDGRVPTGEIICPQAVSGIKIITLALS